MDVLIFIFCEKLLFKIIKTKDDKNEDKMYSNLPENELNNPEKQNNIIEHLWKTIRYQIMK